MAFFPLTDTAPALALLRGNKNAVPWPMPPANGKTCHIICIFIHFCFGPVHGAAAGAVPASGKLPLVRSVVFFK